MVTMPRTGVLIIILDGGGNKDDVCVVYVVK